MVVRAFRGASVITGGAVVALIGTFLPWLRSGTRNRSSYTIFELIERLGFAPGGVVAWSLRLWPLVPLLLVATIVTAWAVVTEHAPTATSLALSIVTVVWVGGTAVSLYLAPDVALFRVGAGPAVTLVGAAVILGGSMLLSSRGSGSSATS